MCDLVVGIPFRRRNESEVSGGPKSLCARDNKHEGVENDVNGSSFLYPRERLWGTLNMNKNGIVDPTGGGDHVCD